MSNLPAVRNGASTVVVRTHQDAVALGQTLASSGYFKDARDAAQAAVKVMAGAELGLPPVTSMSGIHIVEGKPTIGAGLMATLVKKHPNYSYRVVDHTVERCEIAFYEHGEEIGRSEFTMAEAKNAGLVRDRGPWKAHPKNMLFARALSNGVRWHCPDVLGGPVYTHDEMGLEVNADGEVISPIPPPTPPPVVSKAAEVEVIPSEPTVPSNVFFTKAKKLADEASIRKAVLEVRGIESTKGITEDEAERVYDLLRKPVDEIALDVFGPGVEVVKEDPHG